MEEIFDFYYVGCSVTYKYDENLNKKINLPKAYIGNLKNIKRKTRKETI
jgi:hypothetical protein